MFTHFTRVLSVIFLLGLIGFTSAQYEYEELDSAYNRRSDPSFEGLVDLRDEYDRSLLAREIVDHILEARMYHSRGLEEDEEFEFERRAVEQVVHLVYKDPDAPEDVGEFKLYGKTFADIRQHLLQRYRRGSPSIQQHHIHVLRGTTDNEVTNYNQLLQDAGLQHGQTVYFFIDPFSDSESSSSGSSAGSGGDGGSAVVGSSGIAASRVAAGASRSTKAAGPVKAKGAVGAKAKKGNVKRKGKGVAAGQKKGSVKK